MVKRVEVVKKAALAACARRIHLLMKQRVLIADAQHQERVSDGRMLLRQKARMPHGTFTHWLEEQGYRGRTARRWMADAKAIDEAM